MPTLPQPIAPLVPASLALLLAAAVLAPLFARKRRAAGWIHFAFAAAAGAGLAWSGIAASLGAGMPEAALIGVGPFSIPVLVDGLAGVFLAVIGIVSAVAALYAVRYLDHAPGHGAGGFYAAFPLFVFGMAALVIADDLSAGFSLGWQVMTLASYALIRYDRGEASRIRAANRYLVLMELAWLAVVVAGILAGGKIGDTLHEIGVKSGSLSGLVWAAVLGLLLFGFGLKAGVFPLGQLWLPDAHSVAPSPVSALLSGVMLKTGIFGLIRTFFFLAPASPSGFDAATWGTILAAAGAATLFIGTIQSVKQHDAKRLLAYSSIGQIGYIVLGLGAALLLSGSGGAASALAAVAFLGALFHVLNHAIFKSLLFLTSGSLLYATGTKDLNRLGGLIGLMPATAAVAAVASLSISGMPPTSGFASKWTIISSSILGGGASWTLVVFGIAALFTSAVTLACYVKYFGMAFTAAGSEWILSRKVREVPGSMLVPQLALAAVCAAQGLVPAVFVGWAASALRGSAGFSLAGAAGPSGLGGVLGFPLLGLRLGSLFGPLPGTVAAPLVVLALFVAAVALASWLRRSAGSKTVPGTTWLCGYQDLNERTRYTDRGMFAAFKDFFRWTGGRLGPK